MTKELNLNEAHCEACNGLVDCIEATELAEWMALIDDNWQLNDDNDTITRSYKFKNFAKTMFFVNALAHMADQERHHPDVTFGYNYCQVSYTTHEAGGLTRNDFICAKKVDTMS
ncbi:4a-hydroxytetrahydrobiopterin dehydratase [Marinicella rhabdoformis]|uniref:4a-hydroxytetrahydrobiopterin dehydratase n=1 Tax=Marinicella rhabdoformis TaxID=2580566 RepID=UPI0012AEDD5B|nr:4a-hydroxytetrahydrobiopterin dehydratase [Marinicella rhabdoformis]